MKALILSAGLGTRLHPLTTLLPKPLIPVCNIPLLDIITARLKRAGFTHLGINLHHLPERIREHLARRDDFDTFYFSHEPEILGTGGGIAGFADFLEDQEFFFVHNGDILTSIDIEGAVEFHRREKAEATLILVNNGPTNSITILPDHTMRDIWGKLGRAQEGRTLTFSGLALYSRSLLGTLPRGTFYSIIDVLLERLRGDDRTMRGYVQESPGLYWRDVGSISTYLDIHRDIMTRRIFHPPGLEGTNGPVLAGKDAYIDRDARLGGFAVLGGESRIGRGAHLEDCVVWPRTEVHAGRRAQNTIFADRLEVEA